MAGGIAPRLGGQTACNKRGQALGVPGLDVAAAARRRIARAGVPVPVPPLPRGERPSRWPLAAVLVGLGIGIAAASGYFLRDRQRREAVKRRLAQVQSAAHDRYVHLDDVKGAIQDVRGRDRGRDLQNRVVAGAVSSGGELPRGVELEAEGRTVHLAGELEDAGGRFGCTGQ